MKIMIYGTPTCPKCNDVKNFLVNRGVDYGYKVIGKDIDHDAVCAAVGRIVRAAPVIMVDDTELSFKLLQSRLDALNGLDGLDGLEL